MGKTKFSPVALDQLLSDALQDTEQLQNELATKDQADDIAPAPPVSPNINQLVNSNQGLTVDYSRVYSQLERLIENGNIALQVLGAIDPDISRNRSCNLYCFFNECN